MKESKTGVFHPLSFSLISVRWSRFVIERNTTIHLAASTSAMCMVRMCRVAGLRRRMPPRCIRQLMSGETTTSAPLRTMFSALVRPMASDVPGIFTLKVPPKPQHSSTLGISHQVMPRTFCSSVAGGVGHAQLAPPVTADVQRHLVRKAGPGVGHAQDVDQELGRLEDAAADAHDPRIGVDVAEKHPAHRRAGGRRADDPAMLLENVAEVANHPPGLFPIARVECRLAAAGLLGRIDHRHALPLEQLGRRPADLRDRTGRCSRG